MLEQLPTERYDRQIMLPEIGPEGQAKLARARVLVVGVGGLGSPIALYLAGAGVGTLGLVDNDTVSRSNLQRQVLYGEEEVGRAKALCARQRLEALNHDILVRDHVCRLTPENAAELIGQYDLVVDGCDNFATRYLIDDTCAAQDKPYIYGAIRAFDGQVPVFNHPQRRVRYRHLFPDEATMLRMPVPPRGVLGVTPGIVGSVEASEALKLIAGFGEPLVGKLWTIDLLTMQAHVITL